MTRLLDWRLRSIVRRMALPDLPEVRKFMRAAYWNGFTGGILERKIEALKAEALEAIARHECQP